MMKRIQPVFVLCMLGMSLILGGCGDFPELTDDQYREVVNYAAGLITRYSRGSADKLVNMPADYTPEGLVISDLTVSEEEETPPVQEEVTAPELPDVPDVSANDIAEAPDTTPESLPEEGTETEAPVPAEEGTGGDAAEDVASADNTGRTYEAAGEEAMNTPLTPIGESWLQSLADGIRVEYTGYSVRSAYPDTEAQGAVYAGSNERLLVLDFRLRNTSGYDAVINTARYGPAYKVVINGTVQGFTLVTMIDNDLSSMVDTLSPGEKKDVVLVMQLPADVAKTVDKLDLRILQGTEMQTINLE